MITTIRSHKARQAAEAMELRHLDSRISKLRTEIAAAERKRCGIDAAIASRRLTLNRLLAQLAIVGEPGSVLPNDGQ